MLIIRSDITNPFFNIASEEYLLKKVPDDVFLLYVNDPSIVVGKHQNTLAEINYRFVRENSIHVVRRLSGGGTVYHDRGNLNFAFIQHVEGKNLIDFKKYTAPIISILKKLGVNACFEGKNDLRVNGLKISGNAEHVFKKRVLHHGTILFDSDLNVLNEAIRVAPGRYRDKAVKSIRSVVTNIRPLLTKEMDMSGFIGYLETEFLKSTLDAKKYRFTKEDNQAIRKLIDEKYISWEWNFGYSPNYELVNDYTWDKDYKINVTVEKGKITSVKIIDDRGTLCFEDICNALIGLRHREESISNQLKRLPGISSIRDDLVYAFL